MKQAVVVLWLLVIVGCYSKKPQIKKIGLEGKPMPTLTLLAVDSSTIINTDSITKGKPTLLFCFETWCPFCKAQTQSILSNINELNDLNIYLICNTGFSEFKNFYHHYQLDKYPNIKAGFDYNTSFIQYFESSQVPCLAIYDTVKNLKQVLIGKTPIRTIKSITVK